MSDFDEQNGRSPPDVGRWYLTIGAVSDPNLGSAVGFTKWSNLVNGDFETCSSAVQSEVGYRSVAPAVLPTAFQPKFGER
ncbi:hypothetical protein FD28_GL000938 [Levilactobacillus hammesii DSM 16381]|uniref:Uncharacterized protein n=1 Tax=Levilactobacillus hammesii DSM 16381 TaxID=1423753 RepID=A0A0R1UQR8_9LACO|nr:hypothetical protein FD28_GL000938 [Levilactobacillus hammesii DSM 16381]